MRLLRNLLLIGLLVGFIYLIYKFFKALANALVSGVALIARR